MELAKNMRVLFTNDLIHNLYCLRFIYAFCEDYHWSLDWDSVHPHPECRDNWDMTGWT